MYTYESLEELRIRYGSSFYIFNSDKFKENYRNFLNAFKSYYPSVQIGYSYKTNYLPAICEYVDSLGGLAEVVSEMEFDLAIKVGVDSKNIIVNGPIKSDSLIKKCILGMSILNIDSISEYNRICSELEDLNQLHKIRVGIRCNFNIGSDEISRFGLDVESDEFKSLLEDIAGNSQIDLEGIHCHYPDRNLDSYRNRADGMVRILDKHWDKLSHISYIDLGGGYFGSMPDELSKQFDAHYSYSEYAGAVGPKLVSFFEEKGVKFPKLILEPGSALVADVMEFAASIVSIRNIRGHTIATASGSKFNIGLLTSKIQTPMKVYNPSGCLEEFFGVDIAGFTCIESDYLYRNYSGVLAESSIVIFENVGSYSLVFKPPFIMPNCAVLEFQSGNFKKEVARIQTLDDIVSQYCFGNNL